MGVECGFLNEQRELVGNKVYFSFGYSKTKLDDRWTHSGEDHKFSDCLVGRQIDRLIFIIPIDQVY
jgi:hypothetical protein